MTRPEATTKPLGSVGLRVTEYPAGLVMAMHSHEPAFLSLVLSGGYEERMGWKERTIRGPWLVFNPRGKEHAVRFGALSTRILNIMPSQALQKQLEEGGVDLSQEVATDQPSRLLVDKIRREFESQDRFADLALESAVLELFVHLGRRAAGKEEAPVEKVKEYLHEHFRDSVSLHKLSELCGLHASSLARAFRRQTGKTVGDYVRELRIAYATNLVTKTDRTLGEISAESGFADQAHMTRTFKQTLGLAPSALRR